MNKKIWIWLSAVIALSPSVKAIVIPIGPPAQGTALQGACSDGYELRCTSYYGGNGAAVNSKWVYENATGVGLNTVAPVSNLDVNGNVSIGTYAGSTAGPANGAIISGVVGIGTSSPASTVQLTVAPLNANTTGQIVNGAASQVADLVSYRVNGATVTRVGGQGHLVFPQYYKASIDTLVPDDINSFVFCKDCAGKTSATSGALCQSTGTAVAQFVNLSTAAITAGIGVGIPKGCGSGQ